MELARTATLVPDLERKISIKENDIAFLAGEYPRKIARAVLPKEPELPESLPVGLPSILLERRPDVRQAEQKLIAANASVGIAYTNMFPRLSLTAHYGLESAEFADFLKSPYHFLSGFTADSPVCHGEEPLHAEGEEGGIRSRMSCLREVGADCLQGCAQCYC